ncbi:MAG TPA: S8 family serine peptidase, partial [Thermoanaerobaculia bacterium]|nr:S8 family serine peptidase [Thermoanaerobaculia bacterium]
EMATMVAEGMAVFASSGDNGAFECDNAGQSPVIPFAGNPKCVLYPAGDPNVVSVGGVTAPLNNDGTVRTQFTAWGRQTTAGGDGTFSNNVGSGGGISTVFPAPPWQASLSDVAALGHGMRTQPDISLMADPATGPLLVTDAFTATPAYGATGGTSLSAPQMAAMWSLVLQACSKDAVCNAKSSGARPFRLGNPAPLLYAIYGAKPQYAATIFDVLYGNNGANVASPAPAFDAGYLAGPGYDLVTGIGVPFAGHLINAILTEAGGTSPNLP